MNNITLIGRITKDIELKNSNNNKKYTQFSLAVNDWNGKEKITQFINCVAWEKTAETIYNYVKKGNQLAVEGKLNVKFDKDKNTTYVSVSVNKVTLLDNEQKPKQVPTPEQSRYISSESASEREIEQDQLDNNSILWD